MVLRIEKGGERDYQFIKNEVLAETRKIFKPEFLNRIDELIVFHKLTDENLREITDILLEKVIERIKKQGIEVEITENAKKIIMENGSDHKYGARPLRRTIQNLVEDKVAEKILEGNFEQDKKIILDGEKEEIFVK